MRSTFKICPFTLMAVLAIVSCKKINSDANGGGNLPIVTLKKPPKANAGLDQVITLPADSVLLDGTTSSDPDGMISVWLWTKISGPASFNISNSSTAKTKITNLIAGVYQFVLQVTDNDSISGKDTVSVFVQPQPSINCSVINGYLLPIETPLGFAGSPVAAAGNKILFGTGPGVNIYDISTNSWASALLSLPRQGMAIAAIGNKVFFAGGAQVTELWPGEYLFTLTTRVDIYNATTNTWSTAELSQPRELLAAASAGNKILFGGGVFYDNTVNNYQPPVSSAAVDIYDISTNTWSVDSLSQGRSSLSATASGNKIYFAGGVSGTCTANPGFSNMIDIYDAVTNSWSVSSLSCEGKAKMASIAAGNKIFWAGGSISFTPLFSNMVEVRDLNTQTSSCIPLCYQQGTWHSDGDAAIKDNKVVFYNRYEAYFEIYNLSEDKLYTLLPDIGIKNGGIISVNNTIYVGGGYINGILSTQLWKLEF